MGVQLIDVFKSCLVKTKFNVVSMVYNNYNRKFPVCKCHSAMGLWENETKLQFSAAIFNAPTNKVKKSLNAPEME